MSSTKVVNFSKMSFYHDCFSIHFKSFELFSKVIQRMFRKVQFPCQSHTQITPLTCFTAPLRVLVYLNEYGGKNITKVRCPSFTLGLFSARR